jgi:SM-20-related protein
VTMQAAGPAVDFGAASVAAAEPLLYRQMTDFLPPIVHAGVLEFALQSEPLFTSATVTTVQQEHRRSRVLHDLGDVGSLFRFHLYPALIQARKDLGVQPALAGDVECQLTAHNDANFYKLHNDNGSPETATRAISYVYYFNRAPRGFSGGALKLHYSRVEGLYYVADDRFVEIEPIDNSLVLFASHHLHEVLPVTCPSGRFEDSRFTLNGWARAV